MLKIPKEYAVIIDPFLKTGEITLEQGSRHMKIVHKSGHKCPMPSSPGDRRGVLNFKSQFKRFLEGHSVVNR